MMNIGGDQFKLTSYIFYAAGILGIPNVFWSCKDLNMKAKRLDLPLSSHYSPIDLIES